MLSRYHILVMSILVTLGIAANFALPAMRVPMPWTVFLLIMVGAFSSSFYAFAGAAKYSSPTLISENMRFSRYPKPIRYVSDGRMLWSAVPVKGWTFLQKFINSASNPAVAIQPASMLEQESDYYTVARCRHFHLTPRAVQVLSRKRAFARLLAEIGHTPERPLEVYLGFQSTTLHPDATHVRSRMDLAAYGQALATDERLFAQVDVSLADYLDRQLGLWQRIQGSAPARVAVQGEDREGQQ